MEACPYYFSPSFFLTTFTIFTFAPTISAFDMEQFFVCAMHGHCQGQSERFDS